MSCGDGSGHQLDTGFGAGWSNNLNEGTVLKTRIYPIIGKFGKFQFGKSRSW